MQKRRIALDVDGVMVDFLPGFEKAFEKVLGRPAIRVRNAWALEDAYNATSEEIEAVWQGIADMHIYRELAPLPGAIDALHLLQEEGYELHAVTAIQHRFEADRRDNLRALGFRSSFIHPVGDLPKTPVLRQIQPLWFADDQVKHLHAAPFVPHRVWIHSTDEQFPEEAGEHTHEARSLLEFVEHWLDDEHHRLKV